MTLLILANRTQINHWANTRAAQDRLPELLRRLVFATTEAPTYVDFPAGDAVHAGGYDGVIELTETHASIPMGLSVWETGVTSDVKGKADEDYKKRTASPPPTARGPVAITGTTFVFVTPRRWGTKEKWAIAKRGERRWRDVRALNADDLEAWSQQAPAVHVWLSRSMGLIPAGADDLETAWADRSESLSPPASPALFLAGRAKEAGDLIEWIDGAGGGTLTVSGESTDDSLCVIAAAIMALPVSQRTPILARAIVVSSADALIQLAGSSHSLILIPTYPVGSELQRALRGGHRILLPTGVVPGAGRSPKHLPMQRVNRQQAQEALVTMGLREDRARDLAGVARRSMLSLRRQLASTPAAQQPEWTSPSVGSSLVPMLLLGQFDDHRESDLQALATAANKTSDEVRANLQRWSHEIDPPIRKTGSTWYLVSKEDAWQLLGRYVTADDLSRFASVAKAVLSEVHPKFDLSADEQWVASIHGKVRQYSDALVIGVADTIALLGALDHSLRLQHGALPSAVADRIVRELFETVAGDWRGWATLTGVLPLLAEGAPDVFLRAVEAQVANDEDAVRTLFRDQGDVMFSASSHTGILWALEVLSWSSQHLAHAARILATLDRLDPGGRLSNRPGNSLRSIFHGWMPQTSAGMDIRLDVIGQLRIKEPEAAWRLMANLFPDRLQSAGYNPRPKWRDWVSDGAGAVLTYRDIYQQLSKFIAWMIEDAGDDPSRWVTLVEALDDVPTADATAIAMALDGWLKRTTDDALRAPVSDALRELLSRHRSFADADWALPEARLTELEPLLAAATPHGAVLRLRWLFDHNPQMPEGGEQDSEEHGRLVADRQAEAIRELHGAINIAGLQTMATQVEAPDALGFALARSGLLSEVEERELLEMLLPASDSSTRALSRGYGRGWTVRVGEGNALQRIADDVDGWSNETRARLLLFHEPAASALDVVDRLSQDGQRAFWMEVRPFWLKGDVVERGLRALLAHGRTHTVIDAAAMHLRKQPMLDPGILAEALERAPQQKSDPDGTRMTSNDIGVVLDALERAAQEGRFEEIRVAGFELLYLPALGHFTRQPRVLHRAMAKDPSFFVDAVRRAYRAEGEDTTASSAEDANGAMVAYQLLDTWRAPPGITGTGLDAAALNAWVDAARERLAEIGRRDVGDTVMGQVMSGSASDSDGAWPLVPIRDLIERLASDAFEQGLVVGRYNRRGVITRDASAGGDMERAEADSYDRMASTVTTRWTRTAVMLRRMAQSARMDAVHEDDSSELRDDLLD